jgi:hypothetical protein
VANVNLSFGVTGLPNPDMAGTSANVTVTAKADSVTNTAYRGTVHFASNDSQIAGLPADYTFTAADNGAHTFSGIILKTAGSRSITVTDASASSIVGSQTVTVTPAAASVLLVNGFPATITAGTAGNVTVTAKDPYGNTATGYTGTVHFTSGDIQASLPADYAFVAGDNGVHSFSATLKTVGSQSITATDTVTSSITGTQAGIVVTPAPASQFLVSTDAASPDVAGTVFDVTVTAADPYGNTDTNYTGTVTFTSADPFGATLPADYTFQSSDQGQATFSGATALYTAGTWDVTATDTNSGSNGAAFVTVQAAPAVALQISAPPTATSGVAFDVTVTAVDPYGNTDINYAGTITWTTSDPDPGVMLPPDYTFQSGDQGMVTFAGGVTLITPGDQMLMVSDTVSGITGSATVTVTTAPRVGGGGNSGAAAQASQPACVVAATTGTSAGASDQALSVAVTTAAPAASSHALDSLFAVNPDPLSPDGNLGDNVLGRTL